jgi:glycosyltransferase involved in cell wall biosynthesis
MNIAYITTCFGTPSHTFIRRELYELSRIGHEITLYGIRLDPHQSHDGNDFTQRTNYIYPIRLAKTVGLNFYYSIVFPARYWSTLAECFSSKNGRIKNRCILAYHFFVSASLAQQLIEKNTTHLHSHFLNVSTSVAMFAAALSGSEFSITIHSAGEKDLGHVLGIEMKLRRAKYILMISRYNIEYYDLIFPCRDKSMVVRCGIDVHEFIYQPKGSVNGDCLRLLAVGRLVEKKGFSYLLEAIKNLKFEGLNISLTLIGTGPLEMDFRQFLIRENLNDCVKMKGVASSNEVLKAMQEADVLVVPSVTSASGEMEGIPVVLMEAMAIGLPVIATDHSGISELVSENTGKLVPERDVEALCSAISKFQYSINKVSAARNLIERDFNIQKTVLQRVDIFSQEHHD